MLNICMHGGQCCGIRHMFSFGNYNSIQDGTREDFILKSLDSIVKAKLPDNPQAGVRNCPCPICVAAREANAPEKYKKRREEWITAVECVLAGEQHKVWKEPLERCGFKEVFSFKNSNSRNMCHVFYGTTNPVIVGGKDVESAPKDTEIAA